MSKSKRARAPEAPTEPVARWCSVCGGEIYLGQSYYEPEGRAVCCDCLPGFSQNYFLKDLRVALPPRQQP